MKKMFSLLLLTAVSFWACNKKCDVAGMNYTVNGVVDLSYNYKSIQIPLKVNYISGVQEKVDLTISGFPNGIISKFSTSSGIPSFNTILEINHDSVISEGLYPINIECKSESGVIKNFKFNLNITTDFCGNYWAGRYDVTQIFDGKENGPAPYRLASDTNVVNRLVFYYSPLGAPENEQFFADFNCVNNTLNVPEQRGISGNGTYSYSNNSIELNLVDGSGNKWTMKLKRN